MIRLCNFTYIVFILLAGACRSQTNDEIIYKTASEVINAIQKGDTANFISLIGVDNLRVIGKNEEMIGYDIKIYKNLFEQYLGKEKPSIKIVELYNNLGEKLVKVPLYSNTNKVAQIKEMHLSLLFGPPNFIPLHKISGYKLIENNSDSLDFHPLSYWHK